MLITALQYDFYFKKMIFMWSIWLKNFAISRLLFLVQPNITYLFSLVVDLVATLNNEVKEVKGKVDSWVQTMMKLLKLPGAIRELKTRMKTLEDAS